MDFSGMDPKDARKAQRGWDLAAKHRIERAAPELLAALEAILDDVQGYGLAHPEGGRFECDHNDAARTAIRRARGVSA